MRAIHVRVTGEQYETLRRLAYEQRRSQAEIIREALEQYLKGESSMAEYIEMTAGEFRAHIAEDDYWQEDAFEDDEWLWIYPDGSVFPADDPAVAIEGPCEEMEEFLRENGYFGGEES